MAVNELISADDFDLCAKQLHY